MNRFLPWLSLFGSTGTLLCCALPSLLVALGMGATMAGLVTAIPGLVVLSQYKTLVFSFSGLLISGSTYLHYRSRNKPCPIDPVQAKACTTARKWSFWILLFSGGLWITGAFFAFAAPFLFA